MNEKKIRREIRDWKVTVGILLVASLVAGAGAFYCELYPVPEKASDYVKVHWLVLRYFCYCVCIGAGILAVGGQMLRRQAEYALYFKELITSGNQSRKDQTSSVSPLDRAA